jgi:dTMP kinase
MESSKKRNTFICFIGLDGAGKSTLAQKAHQILQEYGIHAKYVWGAYDLFLLRPIVKFVKRALLHQNDSYKDYEGYQESIKEVSRNSVISKGYQILILLEYMIEIMIKITLPRVLGKSIISDRYVYDTATNICSNLNSGFNAHRKMIEGLLKICPKPEIVIYVDVPEEISIQRKNDIPSIIYLQKRKKYYQNIIGHFDVVTLDGTKDLNALEQSLREIIQNRLK